MIHVGLGDGSHLGHVGSYVDHIKSCYILTCRILILLAFPTFWLSCGDCCELGVSSCIVLAVAVRKTVRASNYLVLPPSLGCLHSSLRGLHPLPI